MQFTHLYNYLKMSLMLNYRQSLRLYKTKTLIFSLLTICLLFTLQPGSWAKDNTIIISSGYMDLREGKAIVKNSGQVDAYENAQIKAY